MSNSKKLVEMTYYRGEDPQNIKRVVVTEKQACDIKFLLPHIRVIGVNVVSEYTKRDYILR